jgi:hypothetical protein
MIRSAIALLKTCTELETLQAVARQIAAFVCNLYSTNESLHDVFLTTPTYNHFITQVIKSGAISLDFNNDSVYLNSFDTHTQPMVHMDSFCKVLNDNGICFRHSMYKNHIITLIWKTSIRNKLTVTN